LILFRRAFVFLKIVPGLYLAIPRGPDLIILMPTGNLGFVNMATERWRAPEGGLRRRPRR